MIQNNSYEKTQIVINADNLETLKQYPDNFFDAVVTDPPYGLGKEPNANEMLQAWITDGYMEVRGAGFMGKEWDAFVPQPIFWKEVFRVLKHGGHVLSFFGTRTYDWGVMAMRLAGFEVRDCIQWVYGCLSDDTEILTEEGWVEYRQYDKSKNSRILAYNKDTDEYFFEIPERWNEYTINDTCYRIQSNYTDQIVSRNHRCLIEREGVLLFEFAETLSQEQQASIPFLESVSNMPKNISDIHKGTSHSQQSMWEELSLPNNFNKKETSTQKSDRKFSNNKTNLPCLSERILQKQCLDKKSKNFNLFKKMQRVLSGSRLEETRLQRQTVLVRRNQRKIPFITNGGKQSRMERRYNISKKERVLCRSQIEICKMPKRVYFNGEERWVCSGVQIDNGKAIRQGIVENRVRSPYRPQSNEQRYFKSNVICNKQGTQTLRTRRSYSTTLATFTPIEYKGVIFCPTVSTGAFVARRNGKIFITGNSGFPKSHNISLAIDKMYGAEREVIGKQNYTMPKADNSMGENSYGISGGKLANGTTAERIVGDITSPATEQAKEWEGWGSAIKPAVEPIVLARKPLEKGLSIAENVLKWGTGAINIDGCRVGNEVRTMPIFSNDNKVDTTTFNLNSNIQHHREETTQGRFPANIILSHHPDCECKGLKKIDEENNEEVWECHEDCPIKIMDEQSGLVGGDKRTSKSTYDKGIWGNAKPIESKALYNDTGGSSRFFYIAKASKSERNRGLIGFDTKQTKGGGGGIGDYLEDVNSASGKYGSEKAPNKNFHPTVKPVKLMQYLVRLITPPNGLVLDPFCGSGTTGIACRLEDFHFVGMELDAEYAAIAQARIVNYTEEPEPELEFIEEEDTQLQLELF